MARTEIPVTKVTTAGVAPPAQVTGDAAEKHFLQVGDGNVILEATNTGTVSSRTVTVETPVKVDGLEVGEVEVVVPKETVRYIGPFKPGTFKQKDGKVNVDPAHAELKFRAYRV